MKIKKLVPVSIELRNGQLATPFFFFFFFFKDEFKPGSQQKGEIWQIFAGSCTDPSVQRQAKGNLLQGIRTIFGSKIGLLETNVKIVCGKTEKVREVISSDR